MAKAISRTWYRVGLATPPSGVHAEASQLVLASGEHMGQAIAEAEGELAGSWAIAVDHATPDEIPLGESVGKGHIVRLGDATGLGSFEWPLGVLPSVTGGVTAVKRGWIERPDRTLLVIEAQTDADHVVDLFLGMLEQLPAADNLEVRVLDHFEHGDTDVWLTSRVNAKKILRFLDDYDDDLIHNGHVELSIYLRAQKATLRLTEHKTVVWLAENRDLAADVERWLERLEMPKVASLATVADGAHYHFRPAKGRDRKKLSDELYKQRLRKVDTVKVR